MSTIFKPHRGNANVMANQKKNIILEAGEMFIELPNEGEGKGLCKMKIGDGITSYSNLPYAMGVNQDISTNSVTFTESTSSNPINNVVSGAKLNTIIASLKKTCTDMKTSFQAGVDTIYNACVNNGVTPASSTPSSISTAIGKIRTPYRGTAVTVNGNQQGRYDGGGYYYVHRIPEGFYSAEGTDWGPEIRIPISQKGDTQLYNDGYNDGYSNGYNAGKNDGYNTGYNDGRNQGHADYRGNFCIQIRKNGNTVTAGWRYETEHWTTIRDSFSESSDGYFAKAYKVRYNDPPLFP